MKTLPVVSGKPACSAKERGTNVYPFGAAITMGLRRGGLLLSLLVLPLYIPTLIFGTEIVRRGADGGDPATPILFLAGITLAVLALVPFAAAAALRINLR